jgi:hypothetical protein
MRRNTRKALAAQAHWTGGYRLPTRRAETGAAPDH